MDNKTKTVPNQRTITVSKSPTDRNNLYTTNNLAAIDEAALRLQSKGGFKLYMYLAKNQDKYYFALSSAAFCAWSGLGIKAYNTAFEELKQEGYLIAKNDSTKNYIFYDKATIEKENDDIKHIEMAAASEIREAMQQEYVF